MAAYTMNTMIIGHYEFETHSLEPGFKGVLKKKMFRCHIGILTIGITERFKVLGHEPGRHLLAERHIRQGLEGRLQCGRCQQGGEADGGACGQGYQVNDYCSTKIFSATLTVWNRHKLILVILHLSGG